MAKKRAVIYIHTALPAIDKGADGVTSKDIQEDMCSRYCKVHELEVLAVLHDMDDEERPAFRTLMDMVRTEQIDAVVVLNLQRLSRHKVQSQYVYQEAISHNVEIHSVMAARPLGTGFHGPVALTATLIERAEEAALAALAHRA